MLIQFIIDIKGFIVESFFAVKNLIYSKFFKIKFGTEPKFIVIGNSDIEYRIPCYKAVVLYLITNKEMVFYFLETKKYHLANNLVFHYLKSYVPDLVKFENSSEDLTKVITYIYENLE